MGVSVDYENSPAVPVSKLLPGQFAIVIENQSDEVVGNIVYRTNEACSTALIDLTDDDGWSKLPSRMMVRLFNPGTLLKVND